MMMKKNWPLSTVSTNLITLRCKKIKKLRLMWNSQKQKSIKWKNINHHFLTSLKAAKHQATNKVQITLIRRKIISKTSKLTSHTHTVNKWLMIRKISWGKILRKYIHLKTKNKSVWAIKTKTFFSRLQIFSKSLDGANLFIKKQFKWNNKSTKSNLLKRNLWKEWKWIQKMNPKSQLNKAMLNTFQEEKKMEERNPIDLGYKVLIAQTVKLFTMLSGMAVINLRTCANALLDTNRPSHLC